MDGCSGAPPGPSGRIANTLARIEGRIAFAKLFDHFPGLQLVAPVKLSNRVRFREVEELQVRL